jgi:glycosyltransferase involved in cell wall biosynthesis
MINCYYKKNITNDNLKIIYKNIDIVTEHIVTFSNILLLCSDNNNIFEKNNITALHNHILTHCTKKNINVNMKIFFLTTDHNSHVDEIFKDISKIKFLPDLIILFDAISLNLKKFFKCPVYYFAQNVFLNSLDKYWYDISCKKEYDKYINENIIEQIRNSDMVFANSSHVADILQKYYYVETDLFYFSFIPYYGKYIELKCDEKYEYDIGIDMSNSDKIENLELIKKIYTNTPHLKKIMFGKNDDNSLEINKIKYFIFTSFYESCSETSLKIIFNGGKMLQINNYISFLDSEHLLNNKINIVYAFDKNYYMGCMASVNSILINSLNSKNINIFFAIPNSDCEYISDKINSISNNNNNNLFVVNINEFEIVAKIKNISLHKCGGHLNFIGNISRIYIHDYIAVKYYIYMDSDTIVNTNIIKLWNSIENNQQNIIIGKKSETTYGIIIDKIYHADIKNIFMEDIDLKKNIIYTGTYICNNYLYVKNNIVKKIEFLLEQMFKFKKLFRCFTMSLLNISCYEKIGLINDEYIITPDLGWKENVKISLLNNSDILDWSGNRKPWYKDGLYKNYYEKYNVFKDVLFGYSTSITNKEYKICVSNDIQYEYIGKKSNIHECDILITNNINAQLKTNLEFCILISNDNTQILDERIIKIQNTEKLDNLIEILTDNALYSTYLISIDYRNEYMKKSSERLDELNEKYIVIKNYTFREAMNMIIKNCQTKFFIQIDDDFIVFNSAIKKILTTMIKEYLFDNKVYCVCFNLFDPIYEKIQGIKIFRTDIVSKYLYENDLITDREFNKLLINDGYKLIIKDEILGFHDIYRIPDSNILKMWKNVSKANLESKCDIMYIYNFFKNGVDIQIIKKIANLYNIYYSDDKIIKLINKINSYNYINPKLKFCRNDDKTCIYEQNIIGILLGLNDNFTYTQECYKKVKDIKFEKNNDDNNIDILLLSNDLTCKYGTTSMIEAVIKHYKNDSKKVIKYWYKTFEQNMPPEYININDVIKIKDPEELYDFIYSNKINIIIFNNSFSSHKSITDKLMKLNVKKFVMCHNSMSGYNNIINIYKNNIDEIIVVNKKSINKFKKFGIHNKCVNIKLKIDKCISTKTIELKRKILFIGRITKEKNVDFLLEAFQKSSLHKKYTLDLYGKNYLDNLQLCNNANIKFYGEHDRKYIFEIFKNYDYLVLPSYTEGMPCVIIEALSHGLPCICSNVGGISEIIINYQNGILFDIDGYNEYEEKTLYVTDNFDDLIQNVNINRTRNINKLINIFDFICDNFDILYKLKNNIINDNL